MIFDIENKNMKNEFLQRIDDYKFVRVYENYLINLYNDLINQNILISNNVLYKLNDIGSYTQKKQIEANKYITKNYLFDKDSLYRYNKLLGNNRKRLCISILRKKRFNNNKWYNRSYIMKIQLKKDILEYEKK
jgi:hypothetical protein